MYSSVVHWESTTEQNIMMSAKWCHGCATLYASIDKPMSLRRFCFLWVQTNWPDYRAYCLDLSHRTNIEINKIKLLNNHAISFTNLSVIFFLMLTNLKPSWCCNHHQKASPTLKPNAKTCSKNAIVLTLKITQ